eukprot:TRINITY_DN2107_c0_g1_i3.p1 TRINITY_DN2107_c0_g1~~TRINITY_DN2107_c0_g1_i3.p1  ORF type:complete len:247 (+),score=64.74 TRINITY_DN2107_c0_g1_i3:679-1419(+)
MRAADEAEAAQWVDALNARLAILRPILCEFFGEDYALNVADDEPRLLEWPAEAGVLRKVWWAVSLPLAVLFTFTVPNIRKERWERWYVVTLVNVTLWLAGMSYIMLYAATSFAKLLCIPSDVMGLTITAAGSSLPTLFASIAAAKQGFANMAVSSAFGSNTFTILLAFGLPCLLETAVRGHFATPYRVESGAIVATVVVLLLALVLFVASAAAARMHVGRWLGAAYLLLYVVLLSGVVALKTLNIV